MVAAPAGTPAALSIVPGLDMTTPQTALGLVIFGIMLVAILLAGFGVGGSARQRRLAQVDRYRVTTRAGGQAGTPAPGGAIAGTVASLSDRIVRAGGGEERIATKLDRAGMSLQPREWMAVRTGAMFAGALLFGLLAGLVGVFLGALIGWLLARFYPQARERRRQQAFADALPDALQLVVGSLRSGFSLALALDAVVLDSPPGPLVVELGRALGEVRLGDDLADALERAAGRVENDDLAWAVAAIRIQRDTGGNLAEVLETTVETLRERGRLRRHVRALSAEGRLSGYILIGLPFALAAWLLLVRRDYLSALWTTRIGLIMLLYAIVSMSVGIVWMMRWIKVEV